jgi:hypothetical protein
LAPLLKAPAGISKLARSLMSVCCARYAPLVSVIGPVGDTCPLAPVTETTTFTACILVMIVADGVNVTVVDAVPIVFTVTTMLDELPVAIV